MAVVRKSLGLVVSLAAVTAVVLLGRATVQRMDLRPRTDDAYLQADLVHVAPDVSGRIVEIDVRDNQVVRRGDVLFRIDPVPFRLRVAQARAQVDALEARIAVFTDQVSAQTAKADAADRGIGAAQAQFALATTTLARLEPLQGRGFVTAEQVDQARTAKRTAEIALQQARLQAREARQAIESTKPLESELEAARATLALAARDFGLAVVRAPVDGIVTALDVAAGEFAVTGKPQFTLIDTEHWYAIGNFRETQLPGIAPGQRAIVYVLAAPGRPVRGTVESLGGGVAPDEGATFGGLPHVPRSLNWVRIAQRFPVRVLLDAPPVSLMRLGASAVIVIER
jgi:multidrug efflux system membrane fusion protein